MVRDYREGDFPGVLRAFRDGFGHLVEGRGEFNEKDLKLYALYISVMVSASNIKLVATKNGKAVGYLGGTMPENPTRPNTKQILKLIKYYLTYLPHLNSAKIFLDSIFESIQYALYYDYNVPTIDFLTSQKSARGGVGTALVDKYTQIVKDTEHDRIIVGSDSTVNYKFYEKYGFKETKEYNLIPHLFTRPKIKVRACIYEYKVTKNDL